MRNSPFRIVKFLPVMIGVAACATKPDGASGAMSKKAPTDTVSAAMPATDLESSDSVFVAEPASLAVTSNAVFVADVSSGSVLEYSRSGKLVRVIGRKGRGPGEYTAPTAMIVVGDSLLAVVDAALKRLSLYSIPRHVHVQVVRLPGPAISLSASGDTLLIGMQNMRKKTSVARFVLGDTGVAQFGPIPSSIMQNAQVAASYPFSLVAPAANGYRVGFTGADVVYHLDVTGALIDSAVPPARFRRGVPNNLAETLAKGTSAENEAAASSLLTGISRLSDGGTALVHMDFTVNGPLVTGIAYMSTLDTAGKESCADHLIPLMLDSRPMFAFLGDTLFVVQNRIPEKGSEVTTKLTAMLVPKCSNAH